MTGKTAQPDSDVLVDEEEELEDWTEDQADEERTGPPKIRVWINEDQTAVLLDFPNPHTNLEAAATRVEGELTKLELPSQPSVEQLTEIMENACETDEHIYDLPVIEGTLPVESQDGHIEWQNDYFATGMEEAEESENVDYWDRVDKRSVNEGDLLAKVFVEVQGEPGEDVFGKAIKVDKPEKVRIKQGAGVKLVGDEEGPQDYYAEVSGRVRFSENVLSVDNVYTIKGNVNLETGNIEHTGTLVIDGDVEAGATIRVNGDVDIKGMCEAANITAGGTLTVAGGIIGNDSTEIEVGGKLMAKYLLEVRVKAGDDVEINSEIDHSFIMTRGRVLVVRGRITGGETTALGGIRVAQAGADGAAETILKTGIDFRLKERKAEHKQRIRNFTEAADKIAAAVASAMKHKEALTEEQKQVANTLNNKGQQLKEAIEQEKVNQEKMVKESEKSQVNYIVITGESHSGTIVYIDDVLFRINKTVLKPRIVVQKGKRVRLMPLGDDNMPKNLVV